MAYGDEVERDLVVWQPHRFPDLRIVECTDGYGAKPEGGGLK